MNKILRVLIFVLIISIVTLAGEEGWAAPEQWSVNNHWYEAISLETGIDWFAAKAAAEARSGYLATSTSATENTFIFDLVKDSKFWHNDISNILGPWLGGYQFDKTAEPAGHWRWGTTEPCSYTNWAPGEPNNWWGGIEDHLQFLGYGLNNPQPTWNDRYASSLEKGYIIEWDVKLTPLPGTLWLLGSCLAGLIGLRRFRRS